MFQSWNGEKRQNSVISKMIFIQPRVEPSSTAPDVHSVKWFRRRWPHSLENSLPFLKFSEVNHSPGIFLRLDPLRCALKTGPWFAIRLSHVGRSTVTAICLCIRIDCRKCLCNWRSEWLRAVRASLFFEIANSHVHIFIEAACVSFGINRTLEVQL